MAERTGIAWTDHTHNPWIGCTAVSPACGHCYAEAMVKRWGGDFTIRRRTSPANWKLPLRWNRAAERDGVRRRVFCASLADVFDNQVPAEWRDDLWALIRACPALDWQLLTKRPQNIAKMLPPDWGDGYPNVWLGTTVEDQTEADRRIPYLLAVPALVRFLSCEPLLSPVDLRRIERGDGHSVDALTGFHQHEVTFRGCIEAVQANLHRLQQTKPALGEIAWIIIGGESGPGARPMSRAWLEGVKYQASNAGVPVFVKQIGSVRGADWPTGITGKGDDPAQWPPELRVQQMPAVKGC